MDEELKKMLESVTAKLDALENTVTQLKSQPPQAQDKAQAQDNPQAQDEPQSQDDFANVPKWMADSLKASQELNRVLALSMVNQPTEENLDKLLSDFCNPAYGEDEKNG